MCCFGCRSVCCKGIKEDARESILFSKLAMRPWITNVVIILIASGVHQIDSRLYPGTYKALETFLHFDPIQLGALSLGQNLAGNIVGPIWGFISALYSQKWLLFASIGSWAVTTFLVALSFDFGSMLLFRILNGISLSMLVPLSQAIFADLFPPHVLGRAFGIMGTVSEIGALIGTTVSTAVSNELVAVPGGQAKHLTVQGWRIPFLTLSLLAMVLAIWQATRFAETRHHGHRMAGTIASDDGDGEDDSASIPQGSARTLGDGRVVGDDFEEETSVLISRSQEDQDASLKAYLDRTDPAASESLPESKCALCKKRAKIAFADVVIMFKVPSFWIIVLQGVFGAIPWHTFGFLTLWLQYTGFTDGQAALIMGVFVAGEAVGGLIGGFVADKLAAWRPGYGRILTAQISVGSGLPMIALLTHLAKPFQYGTASPGLVFLFCITVFVFGSVTTWCSWAVNRPIFTEIVPPSVQGFGFSIFISMEMAFASGGALLVGLVAEKQFGYKVVHVALSQAAKETLEHNAIALKQSMLWLSVLAWIACFGIYTLLYWTFPRDRQREKIRAAKAAAAAKRAARAKKAAGRVAAVSDDACSHNE